MLRSLNNFQKGTTFPYTASASGGMNRGGMGCGRMDDGELPDGVRPLDGSDGLPDELPGDRKANPAQHPESDQLSDADWANGRVDDGIRRNESAETAEDATYETAEDYIAALNGDSPWIEYSAETNTATITSLAGFVRACKQPSKSVGERDQSPERRLREKDKRRAAYYRFYTNMMWGDAHNYHIALDSGALGIERCAEIISALF